MNSADTVAGQGFRGLPYWLNSFGSSVVASEDLFFQLLE